MSDLRLLSQEQRFNCLADAAHDHGFVVLDLNGCILDWSAGAEQLLGWSATAAIGRHSAAIFINASSQEAHDQDPLTAARENGEFIAGYWQECADGSGFEAEDRTYPLYDDQAQLLGYGKILRRVSSAPTRAAASKDTSHRTDAIEENSAERLKFVLEAARIAIGMLI